MATLQREMEDYFRSAPAAAVAAAAVAAADPIEDDDVVLPTSRARVRLVPVRAAVAGGERSDARAPPARAQPTRTPPATSAGGTCRAPPRLAPAWLRLGDGLLQHPEERFSALRDVLTGALMRMGPVPIVLESVPGGPSAGLRRGFSCAEFDALGALVAVGSESGELRLYDFDSLLSAERRLRNGTAMNARTVCASAPRCAPVHSLRAIGSASGHARIECVRWHPTRADDVILSVGTSPDLAWYDLSHLPVVPTRVLTRAGDSLATPEGLARRASNTDVAFLADLPQLSAAPPAAQRPHGSGMSSSAWRSDRPAGSGGGAWDAWSSRGSGAAAPSAAALRIGGGGAGSGQVLSASNCLRNSSLSGGARRGSAAQVFVHSPAPPAAPASSAGASHGF